MKRKSNYLPRFLFIDQIFIYIYVKNSRRNRLSNWSSLLTKRISKTSVTRPFSLSEIVDSLSQAEFGRGNKRRSMRVLKRGLPFPLPLNAKGIDPARNTKSLGAWGKIGGYWFPRRYVSKKWTKRGGRRHEYFMISVNLSRGWILKRRGWEKEKFQGKKDAKT